MLFAQIVLTLLAVYVGLGVAFAAAFVTAGVARVDHAARGMSIAVRLLLIPGSVALWPILWWKWTRTRGM